MIRSPIGLRLNLDLSRAIKDQFRDAARLGAKGLVLDAVGDLSPDRLSDTGRRDLSQSLRSIELGLIAMSLPTRRGFDTFDELDVRLARADRAFALTYELGARIVLVKAGETPAEDDPRRPVFVHALTELGKRADHRGIRLALETGAGPVARLAEVLAAIASPGLSASVDPSSLLRTGQDPIEAVGILSHQVVHAYAGDASGGGSPIVASHRGSAFPAGVLDWEAYLGSLEEIDYRGYLTIWPDPSRDLAKEFAKIKTRLDQY